MYMNQEELILAEYAECGIYEDLESSFDGNSSFGFRDSPSSPNQQVSVCQSQRTAATEIKKEPQLGEVLRHSDEGCRGPSNDVMREKAYNWDKFATDISGAEVVEDDPDIAVTSDDEVDGAIDKQNSQLTLTPQCIDEIDEEENGSICNKGDEHGNGMCVPKPKDFSLPVLRQESNDYNQFDDFADEAEEAENAYDDENFDTEEEEPIVAIETEEKEIGLEEVGHTRGRYQEQAEDGVATDDDLTCVRTQYDVERAGAVEVEVGYRSEGLLDNVLMEEKNIAPALCNRNASASYNESCSNSVSNSVSCRVSGSGRRPERRTSFSSDAISDDGLGPVDTAARYCAATPGTDIECASPELRYSSYNRVRYPSLPLESGGSVTAVLGGKSEVASNMNTNRNVPKNGTRKKAVLPSRLQKQNNVSAAARALKNRVDANMMRKRQLARNGGVLIHLSGGGEILEGSDCKFYGGNNNSSSTGRNSSCSRYAPYTPRIDESLTCLHPARGLSGHPHTHAHSHAHGDLAPSPTSRFLPTATPAPPLGTRPLHSHSPSRARVPNASASLHPTTAQSRARDRARVGQGQGQVMGRVRREKESVRLKALAPRQTQTAGQTRSHAHAHVHAHDVRSAPSAPRNLKYKAVRSRDRCVDSEKEKEREKESEGEREKERRSVAYRKGLLSVNEASVSRSNRYDMANNNSSSNSSNTGSQMIGWHISNDSNDMENDCDNDNESSNSQGVFSTAPHNACGTDERDGVLRASRVRARLSLLSTDERDEEGEGGVVVEGEGGREGEGEGEVVTLPSPRRTPGRNLADLQRFSDKQSDQPHYSNSADSEVLQLTPLPPQSPRSVLRNIPHFEALSNGPSSESSAVGTARRDTLPIVRFGTNSSSSNINGTVLTANGPPRYSPPRRVSVGKQEGYLSLLTPRSPLRGKEDNTAFHLTPRYIPHTNSNSNCKALPDSQSTPYPYQAHTNTNTQSTSRFKNTNTGTSTIPLSTSNIGYNNSNSSINGGGVPYPELSNTRSPLGSNSEKMVSNFQSPSHLSRPSPLPTSAPTPLPLPMCPRVPRHLAGQTPVPVPDLLRERRKRVHCLEGPQTGVGGRNGSLPLIIPGIVARVHVTSSEKVKVTVQSDRVTRQKDFMKESRRAVGPLKPVGSGSSLLPSHRIAPSLSGGCSVRGEGGIKEGRLGVVLSERERAREERERQRDVKRVSKNTTRHPLALRPSHSLSPTRSSLSSHEMMYNSPYKRGGKNSYNLNYLDGTAEEVQSTAHTGAGMNRVKCISGKSYVKDVHDKYANNKINGNAQKHVFPPQKNQNGEIGFREPNQEERKDLSNDADGSLPLKRKTSLPLPLPQLYGDRKKNDEERRKSAEMLGVKSNAKASERVREREVEKVKRLEEEKMRVKKKERMDSKEVEREKERERERDRRRERDRGKETEGENEKETETETEKEVGLSDFYLDEWFCANPLKPATPSITTSYDCSDFDPDDAESEVKGKGEEEGAGVRSSACSHALSLSKPGWSNNTVAPSDSSVKSSVTFGHATREKEKERKKADELLGNGLSDSDMGLDRSETDRWY